jgi:hypothetical protein
MFFLLTIPYFLVGAKIEYFFYLLQEKIKKITVEHKN